MHSLHRRALAPHIHRRAYGLSPLKVSRTSTSMAREASRWQTAGISRKRHCRPRRALEISDLTFWPSSLPPRQQPALPVLRCQQRSSFSLTSAAAGLLVDRARSVCTRSQRQEFPLRKMGRLSFQLSPFLQNQRLVVFDPTENFSTRQTSRVGIDMSTDLSPVLADDEYNVDGCFFL